MFDILIATPCNNFKCIEKSDSFVVYKLDVLSACTDGWQKINVTWVSLSLQSINSVYIKIACSFCTTYSTKCENCILFNNIMCWFMLSFESGGEYSKEAHVKNVWSLRCYQKYYEFINFRLLILYFISLHYISVDTIW